MAVAPHQNKPIINAVQHPQSNPVCFCTWNIVKVLTSHNQADSGAYYIIQKDFMHFIKKIILQVALALINNLINTFHTSCSQNKKCPKTKCFTDINEYYPGL